MKIFYYEKSKINTIIIKYNLLNQPNYKDTIYVKSLKKVETNSLVIIYKLSDLGNTTFKILKNIFTLFNKNANINIYCENFSLEPNNQYLPINILNEIYKLEEIKINNRLIRTKTTLIKKQKKVGRKSGKKTKSIFDKHKKIIFEELKKNTPKTEILRIIKLNDSLLINTTPQALGQYIKRQQKIKELKKVTKIEPIGGLVLNKQGLYVHKKLI